ncbi:MAG: hypothetical protein ACPGWR_15230 [Ardenticatenaceae bacterium]
MTAIKGKMVHEPFNWKRYPERVNYHMRYMPAGYNDNLFIEILHSSMKSRVPFWDVLCSSRRRVIKDVHICLAIEYLWEQLNPLVIIIMRHPCAMANSWLALNLEPHSRIDLLLSQEMLCKTYLAPFATHLRSRNDYFFEIGAYWGASYFVLSQIAAQHQEWQWVTHESLCVNSFLSFQQLLSNLGVALTPTQLERLNRFLGKNNRQRTVSEGPYSLARVSAKEPEKWRRQLTQEQQQAILAGAEPFGMIEKFAL